MGQALEMVWGYLALKLHRRTHLASGAILKCPCCCEAYDTHSRDLHIPCGPSNGSGGDADTPLARLMGLACRPGMGGGRGVHFPLLSVARPHPVSEIKGGQFRLARG